MARTQKEIEAHAQSMEKSHVESSQARAGSVPPSIAISGLPIDPSKWGGAIGSKLRTAAMEEQPKRQLGRGNHNGQGMGR